MIIIHIMIIIIIVTAMAAGGDAGHVAWAVGAAPSDADQASGRRSRQTSNKKY